MADDVDKTEQPTPKRRQESRREGQVAVSQDAFAFASLLSVTLALMSMGSGILLQGTATVRQLWVRPEEFDRSVAIDMLMTAFGGASAVLLPIFAALVVGVVGIGLLQTRGNVATKRLKPKLSALSPAKNLSKIFKKQGPIELPKSLLKLTLVACMLYFTIRANFDEYFGLSRLPLLPIIGFQLGVILKAYLAGCVALLMIALIDYGYQFWQTEKSMKMSKQEIKDERRQSEGDPIAKARMRSIQYERARRRMMEEVKTADVVVTNPEHISVALRYSRDKMAAPTVVARGAGILAARIREIAVEFGVLIIENKPLARTLYRSVKIGQMIPEKLYQAVAEVLAYVYKLDRSRAQAW